MRPRLLAFADKMPGGVTDANISKVKSMKSSAGGWDQVARNLNVKLSDVNSKLDSFEDSTHKNIKQALADSFSSGAAAGGTGGMDQGMPGGATGGTGTTPGGMYGTDNGSYGSGGIGGGGAGGTGSTGSTDQPAGGSSSNPGSGY